MSNEAAPVPAIDRLLGIMTRLRAPDGCPWDREQTSASLKPQLLEECYEVLEAIDSGDPAHLKEELGDLLLHIVFQAELAREKGEFTFAEVAEGVADKLVRRHPHVFGEVQVDGAAGVVTLWHQLKRIEKPERKTALEGVPRALPALLRAEAIQKKARNVGFDWPDVRGALEKVQEELAEVLAELKHDTANLSPGEKFHPSEQTAEELGDLFFALVNLTRHLKFNAEGLVTAATDKFAHRFNEVEVMLKAQGKSLPGATLEEMEAAWNEVKFRLKRTEEPEDQEDSRIAMERLSNPQGFISAEEIKRDLGLE